MSAANPETLQMDRRRYAAGVILLLGASVLWSLSGAFIKLAYREGVDGVTIAFYRSLFAAAVLLPLARGRLHTLRRKRERPVANVGCGKEPAPSGPAVPQRVYNVLLAVIRPVISLRPAALCCVVFFTLMTVCFSVAFTKTEAANAVILQYTSTLWVFGLSPRLLGEKPRRKDAWILVLAMIGIGTIFMGNASTDLGGLVIALTSGLFFALLTLMIRVMRDSDSAAVTLVNNLGSAILLLPVTLVAGNLLVSQSALVWLVLLGVFQFGLPYYLYTLGLRRIPAYQAALITLLEPVLVPVWAYLAVRERVPPSTMVGGALILVALLLFVRVARTADPASSPHVDSADPTG